MSKIVTPVMAGDFTVKVTTSAFPGSGNAIQRRTAKTGPMNQNASACSVCALIGFCNIKTNFLNKTIDKTLLFL